MARHRKIKRRTSPSPARSGLRWLGDIAWHNIRRSAMTLAWIGCIAGLVIAWMLGVPRLQAFASGHRAVDDVIVQFPDAPAWVTGRVHDTLLRTAHMHLESDPLGRDDLAAARLALLDTGWFQRIDQVRRVRDDLVEVHGRFVRPHAVVRDELGDHLVDPEGKLLPKKYPTGARTNFIAITGAHFSRPALGGQWEGVDLAAALTLLGMIEARQWRDQVAAIDIAGCMDGRPMRIITDANCTIIWGSAPGSEAALELLADAKLARLDFLFDRHQRIDANCRGELDLTGERAIVTR